MVTLYYSPAVGGDLQPQLIHKKLHHIIAFPMKLQGSPVILRGPLKTRKADEDNFLPFHYPLQTGSGLSSNTLGLCKTFRMHECGTFWSCGSCDLRPCVTCKFTM